MYVAVTGLKLHGPLHLPGFWWHAVRSMVQARRTPGNLLAASRKVAGWQHTLTVWQDRAAMRTFVASAPHRAAMLAAGKLGVSRTCSFEAESAPDWDQALAYWQDPARAY
jgi:hypothetical protein